MSDVNIMEHIDSSGAFGGGFKDAAITVAGDDFKDTKSFDNLTDVNALVKAFAHTKRDHGRLGLELENTIKRPGKDASEEDIAAFHAGLLKELGAPESENDYEFPRPDDLPKGMKYNEDIEKQFRAIFKEIGQI